MSPPPLECRQTDLFFRAPPLLLVPGPHGVHPKVKLNSCARPLLWLSHRRVCLRCSHAHEVRGCAMGIPLPCGRPALLSSSQALSLLAHLPHFLFPSFSEARHRPFPSCAVSHFSEQSPSLPRNCRECAFSSPSGSPWFGRSFRAGTVPPVHTCLPSPSPVLAPRDAAHEHAMSK